MVDWQAKLDRICSLLAQGKTTAARKVLDELRGAGEVPTEEMWRVHELYGAMFHDLADAEGAAAAYSNAAQSDRFLRSQREHFSNYLFALHYLPGLAPEDLYQQHVVYQGLYRDTVELPTCPKYQHDRIRIGFLAQDFRESSSARFYECLLTRLDVRSFEVYAYALENDEDNFTRHLQASGLTYRCLTGQNLEQMAKTIRWDEIDVLMDLSGHADGGMTLMVMAQRPAPVQLCGIGWFDTTGLAAMDYFLTDGDMDPVGGQAETRFKEQLLRLPHGFCFQPSVAMGRLRRKPRGGNGITFGSFQNFMKISRPVMDCWREILNNLPDSRLVVQDTTRLFERRAVMQKRLENAGLPMERVEVRLGSDAYLEQYQQIDIMLDTFPYPGGAATATALYMGVPVIAMEGDHHSARLSSSILRAAGFSEWLAESADSYIKLALQLVVDKEGLARTQLTLREELEHSALMDALAYVGNFEQAVKNCLR
ncbi:MAG: glycosyl transferase family 41 [Selenomonas sp.]|uniref:O-linked N-acetylglucosamine transferase, SPINDLY family protein n=1 Tax=Selenomonas sp. TaxID=2053611 RepID=UPI0025D21E79|nr:glycosyl transferase family 41 [Selenomonas sp.]MCR5438291.1 glycosyl transferase family 41 [Selenomonas sp.]